MATFSAIYKRHIISNKPYAISFRSHAMYYVTIQNGAPFLSIKRMFSKKIQNCKKNS